MDFHDQLNRKIRIDFPPKRIVSLVPSQTELLYDLGLREEVIGITKFCIYPTKWFRTKTRIGGTKQLNLERIQTLKPDLIIANKEENDKSQIEYLSKFFPVWLSDITTFNDALNMIVEVGKLVDKSLEASNLYQKILNRKIQYSNTGKKNQKVAYFIWRKPYMVAANNTYINEMLKLYGAINVFEHSNRYPQIELQDLKNIDVDTIFLSSEPYPFTNKHFEAFQTVCPNVDIHLVNGEMFSWYGSRMLKSFDYFDLLRNKNSC